MFKILLFMFVVFTINYVHGSKNFIPRRHISVKSHRVMDHHRTFVTLRQKRKLTKNNDDN